MALISGFEVIAPYWDQVATALFCDAGSPYPYGININQTAYSNTGENGIIIIYRLYGNCSTIDDLHVGLFADWDIVDYSSNLAGYDNTRNMAYQYLSDNSNCFGIIALDGMSGARVTSGWVSEGIRDSSFNWISTFSDEPITTPNDYRMWIGSGPFTLPINDSLDVYFAVVAGTNLNNLQTTAESLIQKYELITSINSKKDFATMPERFSLSQNYPNPFNPSTMIKYKLGKSSHIALKIYNLAGQEIVTLVNEFQPAGEYEITWQPKELPSGLYFYKIQTKEFSETRKLILQK